MKKSKVYFTNLRTTPNSNLLDKLEKLIVTAGIDKIDFNNKFTAIKVHFGEAGNLAYIRHNYVKKIVEKVEKSGAIVFVTDSNTLYKGKRKNAVEHLKTASDNGFNPLTVGCAVIIADGLHGNCYKEVEINQKHFKSAKIGSAIADSDIIISLSHFKGHEMAGFGGALKNIGMGSGSIPGKLEMHSSSKPNYYAKNCTACGLCIKNCQYKAICFSADKKSVLIDSCKCVGCGQCIAMCQFNSMLPQWNESSSALGEKIAEYTYAVLKDKPAFHINFMMNISPDCDCFGSNDYPIVPDIGIAASFDPVALDRACVDMVNNAPIQKGSILDEKMSSGNTETDKFNCIHSATDWKFSLTHAELIGLGKNDYETIIV